MSFAKRWLWSDEKSKAPRFSIKCKQMFLRYLLQRYKAMEIKLSVKQISWGNKIGWKDLISKVIFLLIFFFCQQMTTILILRAAFNSIQILKLKEYWIDSVLINCNKWSSLNKTNVFNWVTIIKTFIQLKEIYVSKKNLRYFFFLEEQHLWCNSFSLIRKHYVFASALDKS